MPITIARDQDTGEATLYPSAQLPLGHDLRFSLQDTRSKQYLSRNGWSPNRKTLLEARFDTDNRALVLPPEVTALLGGSTHLLLEEIYINYREAFVWPQANTTAETSTPPAPAVELAIDAPLEEQIAIENVEDQAAETTAFAAPPSDTEEVSHQRKHFTSKTLAASAAALLVVVLASFAVWVLPRSEPAGALAKQPGTETAASATSSTPPVAANKPTDDIETSAQESRIVALEAEITKRTHELNASNMERRSLRGRVRELEEALKVKGFANPVPELQAQIDQQNATILTLRNRLDEATKGSATSTDTTVQSLKEQNQLLASEASEKDAIISELRQDLETLKLKIQQQDTTLAEGPAESTPELSERDTWLAAAVNRSGSVEVAVKQPSAQAALRAAVQLCRERGGRGCSALEAFPGGCIAVARVKGAPIQPGSFWYANSQDSTEAQKDAIDQCFYGNEQRYRCDTAFVRCSY